MRTYTLRSNITEKSTSVSSSTSCNLSLNTKVHQPGWEIHPAKPLVLDKLFRLQCHCVVLVRVQCHPTNFLFRVQCHCTF